MGTAAMCDNDRILVHASIRPSVVHFETVHKCGCVAFQLFEDNSTGSAWCSAQIMGAENCFVLVPV